MLYFKSSFHSHYVNKMENFDKKIISMSFTNINIKLFQRNRSIKHSTISILKNTSHRYMKKPLISHSIGGVLISTSQKSIDVFRLFTDAVDRRLFVKKKNEDALMLLSIFPESEKGVLSAHKTPQPLRVGRVLGFGRRKKIVCNEDSNSV